ncbi:MAG: hypothetical protein JNL05_09115 [Flavobacteriales bacterium]|nr:hypothetical protein [Flavobacteriales bacterium]
MKKLMTTLALGLGLAVSAQNYNDLVEVMRSDLRTEKQAIVLSNLGLTEQQSAAFTPIYDQYSTAMKALWDKKIQLIKDYAGAYSNMTDETAKSLLSRSNALEKETLSLRNTYEKKMMKVLPATTVARWAQIENRLGKLIDLQIAEEIPLMPAKK